MESVKTRHRSRRFLLWIHHITDVRDILLFVFSIVFSFSLCRIGGKRELADVHHQSFSCLHVGNLAEKFGPKWIFGGGVFIAGILTLFTPLAARSGIGFLIAIRILTGIVCGPGAPSAAALWGKWVLLSIISFSDVFPFSFIFINRFHRLNVVQSHRLLKQVQISVLFSRHH